MEKKSIRTLLVVGLVVLSAMVVFAGTASADYVIFSGAITNADGDPYTGDVTIEKGDDGRSVDCYNGQYEKLFFEVLDKEGTYTMTTSFGAQTGNNFGWADLGNGNWQCSWDSTSDPHLPEFSTIAIPVASILGLLFFFNHRKHRKE